MTTENQSRLTFAEFLVITAIVAALASLLLPVFAQDRERVGRAASAARYRSNETGGSGTGWAAPYPRMASSSKTIHSSGIGIMGETSDRRWVRM